MKKLTVLFNTWPAAFDCRGGGEVQLLKYMEYLERLGVTTLRYDMWNPGPQFDTADIVHHFSLQTGSWRFCHHVVSARKLPLVISPIVWIDHKEKYPLEEYRTLLHMPTRILPNSQAECNQLAELFGIPANRFSPIVNGVDDIFFEPVAPQIFRSAFGIDTPFILCMGNVEVRKNQLNLINALKGTGITLVIAGQDREQDYAAHCRAAADTSVRFIGLLEHASELQRSAYAAADLLVLASTLETPGLAALEAAACGTRVALTTEGCTHEYFRNFAVYLNPDSEDSIRAAVLEGLRRAQDGERLREFIRARYTWQRAAEQLCTVYGEIQRERER
ncbi:glycosyltransferase [Desulfovibrio sp. ZJ200]|uniref:glycosyltransferase n=1 Tax=Desulfovibrio sp. ZJ200 TaxID=2709792 RepID=UPI0013EAB15A|nr:glycosyltransferase [Desulfovibrio sp. ZJ200]